MSCKGGRLQRNLQAMGIKTCNDADRHHDEAVKNENGNVKGQTIIPGAKREFDSQTNYRAVIEGKSVVLLSGSQLSARRVPSDYPLVKSGVVPAASTLVMIQVPSVLGSAWSEATVYLYGCRLGRLVRHLCQASSCRSAMRRTAA
jgi:hypothetical protein